MWSPLWFSLVCKCFGQKLSIQTARHTFLESRHPEVTENLYYDLSTRQSQITIFLGSRSWTNIFSDMFPALEASPIYLKGILSLELKSLIFTQCFHTNSSLHVHFKKGCFIFTEKHMC